MFSKIRSRPLTPYQECGVFKCKLCTALALCGCSVAFKTAEDEGYDDNSNIDEGFGVRAMREAFNKFGISVQRSWNGAVSLCLP